MRSQKLTAAAQAGGKFDEEIIPVTTVMDVTDKATGEVSKREVTIKMDDCNRPDTTLESLSALQPVMGEGYCITAGNASQLSDGSSAVVMMEAQTAVARGLAPLGRYVGMAVAGTKPDEMGIGPVFAILKLLKRFDPRIDDIGLWELNEALCGSGPLLSRSGLGSDEIECQWRSISIGHPFGMTGARCVGHAPH